MVFAWAVFQDYLSRELRRSYLRYDLLEYPAVGVLEGDRTVISGRVAPGLTFDGESLPGARRTGRDAPAHRLARLRRGVRRARCDALVTLNLLVGPPPAGPHAGSGYPYVRDPLSAWRRDSREPAPQRNQRVL